MHTKIDDVVHKAFGFTQNSRSFQVWMELRSPRNILNKNQCAPKVRQKGERCHTFLPRILNLSFCIGIGSSTYILKSGRRQICI